MSNKLDMALKDLSFKPAWWLPEGHSQTIWRKFRPSLELVRRRQRIELADGDFIDVDWAGEAAMQEHHELPVVILLHGLCGCSTSSYILSLQSALVDAGLASAAMNFRGCSGEFNRLARSYHSGVTEDLGAVFDSLRAVYPDLRFAFAGFSLGANVLLKWLGETGPHPQVAGAVAVSTPFLLARCSRAMEQGFGKLYGYYFVKRLMKDVERKKQHFRQTGNENELNVLESLGDPAGIATIWQFDDRITAPLHGFEGAEDYYQRSSSLSYLKHIQVPTLLIQSRDDPLIPAVSLPGRDGLNGHTRLELTHKGGHVGFFSASEPAWLESRIMHHIRNGAVA